MKELIRRLAKCERGSVVVEFTLFLPVILVILFGIIELGSAWYFKQVMVNASRDGARFASLYTTSAPTDQDVQAYVQNVLNQAGFPGTVAIAVNGAAGGTGTQVSVDITSDYRLPVLGAMVPGVEGTITLQSTTVMRHE